MRFRQFFSILMFCLFTSLASSGQGFAKIAACIESHLTKISYIELNKSFWSKVKPIFLKGSDGKNYPLTYSMDSELPNQDLLRLLLSDPVTFKQYEAMFNPILVEELKAFLNVSDKQFHSSFVLRKGVKRGLKRYRITDLNPSYFSRFEEEVAAKSEMATVLAGQLMRKRGYPFLAEVDRKYTEIRHKSFEKIPRNFEVLIKRLHSDLKAPQTHLHIGLPIFAVNGEEATAIGMAVEAKITLKFAADSIESGEPLTHTGSVLRRDINGLRGPVKLEKDLFLEPTLSHDLEIRQWDSIDHGLELVSFASVLATRVKSLRTFPRNKKFGEWHGDPDIGNIGGALEYLGVLLETSTDSARVGLSRTLLDLSQRVANEATGRFPFKKSKVSPTLRKEIQKALTENRALEIMDDISLYLQPAQK